MSPKLPAITGKQLIKFFESDGWACIRFSRHGAAMAKMIAGRRRVLVIPNRSESLAPSLLTRILRESGLGRDGLRRLIGRKKKRRK